MSREYKNYYASQNSIFTSYSFRRVRFKPQPITQRQDFRVADIYRVAQKSKLLYCVNSLPFFEPLCTSFTQNQEICIALNILCV